MAAASPVLHPDRCFDPDPVVRRVARELYEETQRLPIVSPHGHVDARLLAENLPFANPTALIVTPDHYITRLLYAHGVALESLGISRRDGNAVESDSRIVWQLFAQRYGLFNGTPSGAWLDHELHEVFGIGQRLDGDSGMRIYDEIQEKLQSAEFLPRALFERFNIEILATTDAASDSLASHQALRDSGWRGRVIPTFRPDAISRIAMPGWGMAVAALGRAHGRPIGGYARLIDALRERRAFFKAMGAVATDHAVLEPRTEWLGANDAERLFERAVRGEATADDQRRFEAHLLMEMAAMSCRDGLVMQLHPGAFRDHDRSLFENFGPDQGGDIPVQAEFTHNLRELLNAFGNDARFTLVLFTLDDATYGRELAPLAGHYRAVRLGAPWWFQDSRNGMIRFFDAVVEICGMGKLAGFADDTRAFCSIPARHDLWRRVSANYLAGFVARHIVGLDDARAMGRALAYELARRTYQFDRTEI